MGQEQSSGATTPRGSQQPPPRACRPCGDWGNKDYNTVKVDAAALNAMGKENASQNPNGHVLQGKANEKSLEEERKQQRAREEEAARRVEEQRREMERRVKEEQERQQAEQRQRDAERRRLQLEQEAKEREEQRQVQQQMIRRQAELERKRQEEERQEQMRLQEEARQRKIQEMEDQKKVRFWLQTNGFKGLNDLVRKRLTKVTPLHVAVSENNPDMVRLLPAAGADSQGINGKNETPTKLAQKLNSKSGQHSAVLQVFTTHKK